MKKDIKVAVFQTFVPKNKDKGEKQILRLVQAAVSQPVDLVGLPEDCVASRKDIKNGYDPLPFLSKVARENSIYLFGATETLENDQHFSTGFLFNRSGELIAKHHKIVLTPPEEQDGITPGKTLEVFDTEFGKMALLVCKDAFHRYAAWFFDKLRKAGADIVLIPSYSLNVSKRSTELWIDSLKALAKWFDVYIVASGTIGENATDFPSFGHALIICPNRVVLAERSFDKEEILRATLDVKSLEEIRNTYGSKWQPPEVPQTEIIIQQ
ncbi:MAG: Nitrilase/cyanide hydratase and apolipoprotein N-acyltransferase [candidate division CPR1 bacterium GW2011_GWA2_42_17]|uniref:Nitrilase/cyanide hydratase and apolipoprotein N-acyltransferase n=1 Tax=candidate division CPR1 bacterium GW2011_GWA2_42_17 TaxID=1618341 RepID=A0A0G0Z5J9_9BACT|nr:MAG: Nitrilase/cyanide hydratase and apolipoprotein N-acyltransferase [candidate division CPR1 bacterium GW2011_GWA2_42_17]